MAQNLIEYHIQRDSRLSLKVAAGETLYAGDAVSIKSDMTVGKAGLDDETVIGIVYGGTVGNAALAGLVTDDQTLVGFSGARKESVTVILHGSLIYLPVASPVIGKPVAPSATGYKVGDPTKPLSHIGKIVSVNTKVAGQVLVLVK
ncbi:hypothetical protein [Bacillus mycoides]|uniref:hypothetical protein n=1 Tax=Bacillus mycoides TaxID=1405 RepID=UPI00027C1971|nr:hypothetical protein [Bacillus mycoides]EJV59365.1 hypothetical protein IEU_05630 [Bacillus mycoides]